MKSFPFQTNQFFCDLWGNVHFHVILLYDKVIPLSDIIKYLVFLHTRITEWGIRIYQGFTKDLLRIYLGLTKDCITKYLVFLHTRISFWGNDHFI